MACVLTWKKSSDRNLLSALNFCKGILNLVLNYVHISATCGPTRYMINHFNGNMHVFIRVFHINYTYKMNLTLFRPVGGGLYEPSPFFKITPKRLSLRCWNFVSFSSYFIDAFKKNSAQWHYCFLWWRHHLKGRCKFYGQILVKLEDKWNTYKSHLSGICTWNFDKISFIRFGIHYKRKNYSFSDSHCLVFVLEQWNNGALIKDKHILDTLTQGTSY